MTEKPKRILKFVLDRRKPVTAQMVAQQFAIASSTASTHLRHLHAAGYLTRQEIKGKVIWFKKGQDAVAVPEIVVDNLPHHPPPLNGNTPNPCGRQTRLKPATQTFGDMKIELGECQF